MNQPFCMSSEGKYLKGGSKLSKTSQIAMLTVLSEPHVIVRSCRNLVLSDWKPI